MKNFKIFTMPFNKVYPLLVAKVGRKGHTQNEVDQIIFWLTGYDETSLKKELENETNCKDFFDNAPSINPNVSLIKGVICGDRVEDIKDSTMQKIRYLDKLIDELYKGKSMEKILRK